MALLRRVIGAVLRRVRQRQGRTLRQVAGAAGVSLPYLSEVERGTKEASSEVLAAICRALGMPMPDLLDEVRKEMLRDVPAPRAHLRLGLATQRSAQGGSSPRSAQGGSSPRCAVGGGAPRSMARLRCTMISRGVVRA